MLVRHSGSQQRPPLPPDHCVVARNSLESLQRCASLIADADDAIISNTVDGSITSWNNGAERIFGYTADEMLGQSVSRLAAANDKDDTAASLERIRRGEHANHYEAMRRCKDGREIIVSVTVSGLRDLSGEFIVGALSIARDISARKHEQAAICTQEKLEVVSRLANSLAHSINNPLESVTNLLFLLDREGLSNDGRQFLKIAQRELARVTQISSQALGFHLGRRERVRCSLDAILEDALALHHSRCQLLGVEVSRHYGPAPNIDGDPGEVRQLLLNLISNALDAMPSGGRLWLRIRSATDWVTLRQGFSITVADTGDGMSAETRSRLFQPFFETKKPTGTGLGLWMCASILSRCGGRIAVRSTNAYQRNGSVFRVFLPLSPG